MRGSVIGPQFFESELAGSHSLYHGYGVKTEMVAATDISNWV